MKRNYIQRVRLTILLSEVLLSGYTAITVMEFPRHYQQELDETTELLTIKDRENYIAGEQAKLSSKDVILAKAKEVTTKSVTTAYDAKISKFLSWQVGLFFFLIVTFIVPLFWPNKY